MMHVHLRPPVHKVMFWRCDVCGATGQTFVSATPLPGDTIESVSEELFGDITEEHARCSPKCVIDEDFLKVLSVHNAPRIGVA